MNNPPLAFRAVCAAALVLVLSSPVLAQAKTTAKAPAKAPAALPDWSGLWIGANAATGRPVVPGSDLPLGRNQVVPVDAYTPEFAAKHEVLAKGWRGEGPYYDPSFNCVPSGMPRILSNPYPQEFLVLPNKVVILYEIYGQVRQIYTDGRKHPAEDDLDYTFNGHSIGHWEGDTLVVDTIGIKDSTLLDATNVHSDALHVVERIRRTGPNSMETEASFDDRKAFTKPWKTTIRLRKGEPDWYLKEYVCLENNRTTADEAGHTRAILNNEVKK